MVGVVSKETKQLFPFRLQVRNYITYVELLHGLSSDKNLHPKKEIFSDQDVLFELYSHDVSQYFHMSQTLNVPLIKDLS